MKKLIPLLLCLTIFGAILTLTRCGGSSQGAPIKGAINGMKF